VPVSFQSDGIFQTQRIRSSPALRFKIPFWFVYFFRLILFDSLGEIDRLQQTDNKSDVTFER